MTLKTVRALALLPAPPFRYEQKVGKWRISDFSPTRIVDSKTGALIADLTGLMDAEENARLIATGLRCILNKRGENVLDLAYVPDVIPDPQAHAEHEVGRMVEARATFAAFAKAPELIAALDGMLVTLDTAWDASRPSDAHERAIKYARRILDETIAAMKPEGVA